MASKNRASRVESAVAQAEREEAVPSERYVDMAMQFVHVSEPANENETELETPLFAKGGRWFRQLDDFDGEAEEGVVIRLHPGQRKAVDWFMTWLEAHDERRVKLPPMPNFEADDFELDTDPTHAYSALFAGGRRAGKTWIAMACAVVYAVMYPNAIVWIVSPNAKKHAEVRRYLAGAIADEWLERQTNFEYDFVNGSSIQLKSGHDAELLKEGKANLVVINEGQLMDQRAFTVCRGAIVDQAGLVIVCANPPNGKKDRQWVVDFAAEAAAGRRAGVYIEFNPLLNPHIDRVALLSMKGELDQRSFEIEVLGMFRGPADAVAYNWIRLENEKAVTDDYIDVTDDFLQQLGFDPGITHIVGLDVQTFPHIGGPWYKLFVRRGEALIADNVIAWMIGETVLEGGDEVDFCYELARAGLGFDSTLIICDGTGEYQHSRRKSTDSPPPEWKGRGSFDIIRGCGFRRISPPDRRLRRKNPPIVDRVRAFTSRICTLTGRRRLFADPVKAPKTCHAVRDWRTRRGLPSRSSEHAHLGDGASYPIVCLFPRRLTDPDHSLLPNVDSPSAAGSVNHRPVQDAVSARVDRVPVTEPERIVRPSMGPSSPRRGSRVSGL